MTSPSGERQLINSSQINIYRGNSSVYYVSSMHLLNIFLKAYTGKLPNIIFFLLYSLFQTID